MAEDKVKREMKAIRHEIKMLKTLNHPNIGRFD
jgi:hypothetical protein